MPEKRVTLADILAETKTNRRGFCSNCKRADVPINPEGICAPCTLNPRWHENPRTLADMIFDAATATWKKNRRS
jgi:hypothetical protein